MTYHAAEPSHLSKAHVHRLAETIAARLGFVPGDDIAGLIERMGGRVDIEDILLSDPEQTGSLYVEDPKTFRIIVPTHTSPERDRFTIAHEFGHYILHYLWKREKDPAFPEKLFALRKGSDRIEWEANWFAAAFLMPEGPFRECFERNKGDMRAVAEQFRVSPAAAAVRAKGLGLE